MTKKKKTIKDIIAQEIEFYKMNTTYEVSEINIANTFQGKDTVGGCFSPLKG